MKKSLGQHFLKDPKILRKIANFARIEKEDTVVEVGPGEGTLTKLLLERAKKVIAIEKDGRLAALLKEKFAIEIKREKLEVICEDILNYESRIMNYALIGNIPYYLTGAIFKNFLESNNQPRSITFVVQKEVAERIMARDNKESILSISIKAYGKPEFGGIIKAGSFNPKPKVDSAIISVRDINKNKFTEQKRFSSEKSSDRFAQPDFSPENFSAQDFPAQLEQKFFEILRKGFAHKRKLLKGNLSHMSRPGLDTFKACKIPEKARAENLKVEDWICLAKNLSPLKTPS